MDVAERKLSDKDYLGAKKFINKAQNLYPDLDGLKQALMMIDVYISASNGGGEESDWYGILSVDPSADDVVVKKQYKKLALLLHPDKNRFNGAEGAFKLVLNAYDLLSEKDNRSAYDRKRKPKEVRPEKSGEQEKPSNPRSNNKPDYEYAYEYAYDYEYAYEYAYKYAYEYEYAYEIDSDSDSDSDKYDYAYEYEPNPQKKSGTKRKPPNPYEPAFSNNPKPKRKPKPNPKPKPERNYSSRQEKVGNFWTICNECNTYSEYRRAKYLNKTLCCRNCGKDFVATEITVEIINGRPVIRSRPSVHYSTSKTASDNTTSSTSAAERVKRWFAPDSSSPKRKKFNNFWTVCNRCNTYCQFARDKCLNKTVPCPNCYQDFVASENR